MARQVENSTNGTLQTAVYRIQKSLARIAIKLGFPAGEMNEIVRRAYLDAAEEILKEEGERILTTKLCRMTGLYKKELVQLRSLPPLTDPVHDARYIRLTHVLSGWLRDGEFQTKAGLPAALKLQGKGGFSELVNRYSDDMAPVALRQELLEAGLISITRNNLIKFENSSYLASSHNDAIQIMGTDTADLIDTIRHNTDASKSHRQFQRKVSYIDISQKFVEPFRKYAAGESQKLLVKLDRWLAKHDVKNTEGGNSGSRLGLGIYHIEKRNSTVRKSRVTMIETRSNCTIHSTKNSQPEFELVSMNGSIFVSACCTWVQVS